MDFVFLHKNYIDLIKSLKRNSDGILLHYTYKLEGIDIFRISGQIMSEYDIILLNQIFLYFL